MELLIPSTFGGEERDNKLFAFKIGELARALSIFGVSKITIYKDLDEKINTKQNSTRIEKFLRYVECPPFLRKYVISFDKELKDANILPPLQIPSHGYSEAYRECYVLRGGNPAILECGFQNKLEIPQNLKSRTRVTLEKTENGYKTAGKVKGFWTFEIENADETLDKVLSKRRKDGKIIIGTSRLGQDFHEVKKELSKINLKKTVIVFGCAWRGLHEILKNCGVEEDKTTELFDYMLNLVPDQKTKTVRSEEALIITLAILSSLK